MTGIFFGSSTGNTEELAGTIATKLNIAASDLYNVADTPADAVENYDRLLLGSSTWGLGDLQDDWYDFLEALKAKDLSGKKVGLFGCGDSTSYPDTFCDAIGVIREELAGSGCRFIGEMDAAGYSPDRSRAFENGKVLGLVVDDDEPGQTDERLNAWIRAIQNN